MNDYYDEATKLNEHARQQAEFLVLIWGPGKNQAGYDKRCMIRDVLRNLFPRSKFDFSEDIQIPEIIGTLPKQAVQAKIAKLIIILDISRGAHFEINHFTKYSWFLSKAWVLVPQEDLNRLDEGGFAWQALRLIPRQQIKGFTAEELARSDVAKVMSVDIVTTVAVMELIS